MRTPWGERVALARMDSPDRLFEFWRQRAPDGNDPRAYISATGRSAALVRLVAGLSRDARILEVGCNVGRNLAALRDAGFGRVEGVEINPHAVALLRETYPQLDGATIHVGPAEEVLPSLVEPFDLVFTMAVLEHIHPNNTIVFDCIASLSREVIAIEPRVAAPHMSHRQFPHDVPRIFEARGLVLRRTVRMKDMAEIGRDDALHRYTAWHFVHQ